MNRRRLEAILDVKHRATERFAQGHLVRGVQIEVTLDSHGFAGRGDICLFGGCLAASSRSTDIYLFNRLIIILQPTGERLEWEESTAAAFPADPATGGRPAADQFYRFCQLLEKRRPGQPLMGEPAIRLTIRCVLPASGNGIFPPAN